MSKIRRECVMELYAIPDELSEEAKGHIPGWRINPEELSKFVRSNYLRASIEIIDKSAKRLRRLMECADAISADGVKGFFKESVAGQVAILEAYVKRLNQIVETGDEDERSDGQPG